MEVFTALFDSPATWKIISFVLLVIAHFADIYYVVCNFEFHLVSPPFYERRKLQKC